MSTPPTRPTFPAAHHDLGCTAIFWLLAYPALWNSFNAVRVQYVGRVPRPADGPLIVYMNHPAWWDLYMGMLIDRLILHQRFVSYGMMEEEQVRAFPFFRLCGAFSVNRQPPRAAARSVAYIAHLLREHPGRAFYIFPQGEIVPNDRRPLTIHSGLAHIVRRVGRVVLYPVALRYEFRGEQRPEVFMRLGPWYVATAEQDVAAITAEARDRLTANVDAVRDAVIAADTDQYGVLLRGKPGINRMFAFGWLSGRGRGPAA